jgi:hypothetical protein
MVSTDITARSNADPAFSTEKLQQLLLLILILTPTPHRLLLLHPLKMATESLLPGGALVHAALPRVAVAADTAVPTEEGHQLLVGLPTLQLSVWFSLALMGCANKSQQAPNPSNVLGVFGLSIRTQERDLDEEFSRFGRVEKVTIVYDQRVSPCQAQRL